MRIKKIEREMLQQRIIHRNRWRSPTTTISHSCSLLRRRWKRPHLGSRGVRVDGGWSNLMNRQRAYSNNFVRTRNRLRQPSPSHRDKKCFSWCEHAHTFISRTAGSSVSVCCTNEQIFLATGWYSSIVMLSKSMCGLDHFAAKKKKLLSNFQTSFCSTALGKKLLIKFEKVNYSLKV